MVQATSQHFGILQTCHTCTLCMRYQQLHCYQLCCGDSLADQIEVRPGEIILRQSVPSLTPALPTHVYRYTVLYIPNRSIVWLRLLLIKVSHFHIVNITKFHDSEPSLRSSV